MRILAIRGENLASLAAEFVLDFEQPPLDGCGLFAISGPTGAGKSSILDALCLALFDRMPRLPDGHGVAVGRAEENDALRLRSTDPRSILRRGAGFGYAEVDFVGADRGRYRARWEVRRARNSPGGRMQPQQMAFSDLASGRQLGGTKTETLQAIRDRLGLSFDQFRRSVLLAQGDFAAFLKADADARANLLERITGTGLYSQLSKGAHQRAGAEEQQLRELEQRLQEQTPLAEDARQALEQRLAGMEQERRRQESAAAEIRRVLDWYQRLALLEKEQSAAAADQEQAQAAWDGAAPRRGQLQLIERVQPLRALEERIKQTRREQGEADTELAQRKRQLEQARTQENEARRRLGAAETSLDQARAAREQARPELLRARALDTRLADQQQTTQTQQQRLDTLEAGARQAAEALNSDQQAHEHKAEALAQAEQWLAGHSEYALLAAEWGRWDTEMDRYRKLFGELAANQSQLRTLTEQAAAARQALDQARTQHTETRERLDAERRRLASLEAEADAASLQALSRQRAGLEAERTLSLRARELQQQAANLNARLAEHRLAVAQAAQAEAEAGQLAADAQRQLDLAQAGLREARRALELLQAAQSRPVGELRALLQPGEACPVCGACEHPWRQHPAPLDQETEAQRQRVGKLEAQSADLLRIQAEQQQRSQRAQQDRQSLGPSVEAGNRELMQLIQAWQALPEPQRLGAEPQSPELGERLQRALEDLEQRLAGIAQREAKALERQQQIAQQRGTLEKLQQTEQVQARELVELQRQQERLAERRAALETAIRAQQGQTEQLTAGLSQPLEGIPEWLRRLEEAPEVLQRDCAAWVDSWRQRQQQLEGLSAELQQLAPRLAAARKALEQAQAQVQEQSLVVSQALVQLERLAVERRPLLQGRPADRVERELERAWSHAQQAREQQAQALKDAGQAQSAAQAACRHWSAEQLRRRAALERAEAALTQSLSEHKLEAGELQALLERDQAWIEAERQALDQLKLARERAQTRAADADRRLGEHSVGRPDSSREQAAIGDTEIQAALEQLRNLQAEQLAERKQDDERRARSQELLEQLQRQRDEWQVWAGLRELIGSADGKKFRGFAQSLTLDSLLAHANRHLRDLARRYRLQRVPGSDLELQVIDTDMGDEVRSVHSLSGGESFLVSLALALGLASLSSSRTQVESLFIDEGFGSLDQDTLDLALASLDTLQSLGRKVGVISHVQALVERIGAQVLVEKRGAGQSRVRVQA